MKVYKNGKYIEIEDIKTEPLPPLPYEERIVNRIRERYSIDDEIAILRQRDTKPEEFEEYNAFVEQIKQEERQKEQEENTDD